MKTFKVYIIGIFCLVLTLFLYSDIAYPNDPPESSIGSCPEYFQGLELTCKTAWCGLQQGYSGCTSSGNGLDCSTYKSCR
jgi:hypothetical protein